MTQLRSIDISELDFDQIKNNLKAFLQDQDQFTDYDFEGSALSVLLDVLAYNTHYNAYLANMLANEMFLDSAVKRSSAVSIAKHLGFTPASTRSARSTVDITVNGPTDNPSTLTLNAKTPFSTTISGNTFTFYNLDAITIVPTNSTYVFDDVVLVEGSLANFTFAVNQPGPDEKYEIPDTNIDTSTLKVTVQDSVSNTTAVTYTLTTDTTNVTSTSKVFFLEENPLGRYEIFFGDGVVGKKLTNGNLINIQYLRSSGVNANTSNNTSIAFTTDAIGCSRNVVISVSSNPSSGADRDTITDIKFKAPRVNAARNRAVTASDYEALITANFSDAESVSVWGGEDNDPPYFGKVLISLKPYDGFTISQATKDNIKNTILSNKKVLSIQPEFIDPEYFFVNMVVNINYDSTATTKTSSEIDTIVRNTISNYFSTELQKFNKDFYKSRLIKNILDSDSSIVSVIILIKLQKRLILQLNSLNTFVSEESIKFENSISPGTLSSSRFFTISGNATVLSKITDIPSTMPPSDTGTGTLVIRNALTNTTLNANIGTVNYATGEVSINGFTPTSLPNSINDFRITASIQEQAHNLIVNRNQILILDNTVSNPAAGRDAGLTVNVTSVTQ
jgi:hypothetical protein